MTNSLNYAGSKKLKTLCGNRLLQRSDPMSVPDQFYEHKRREGKRHNIAVVILARQAHQCLVSMMKNGELCREPLADQQQDVA